MISQAQMDRAKLEFAGAAETARAVARAAERDLENYNYLPGRQYDLRVRDGKLAHYQEADYQAESRAWIVGLMKRATHRSGVPDSAICFFRDGDKWCAVHGDFTNLQESPAGFGNSFDEALESLKNDSVRNVCAT